MSDMETKNKLTTSDAILAIALTASTYCIAFAYEVGKANFYKFPRELISVSATMLLIAFGSLLTAALPFLNISQTLFNFLPRSDTMTARTIKKFSIMTFIFGICFSPALKNGEGWLVYIGMIVFMGFFIFIFPLITQRAHKSYEEKLRAQSALGMLFKSPADSGTELRRRQSISA